MNRLIKYTLTVVLTVAMSSCHIYRKYELPADENAFVEDYRKATEQPVDSTSLEYLGWEKVFTDPILQGYIRQALANNQDLDDARRNVEIAQAQLKGAKLSYFPSLALNPNGGSASYGGSHMNWSYSIPLAANWEIDVFGKILNRKRGAKVTLEQMEDYEQAVRSQIICGVANTYYALVLLKQQLDLTERTSVIWKDQVESMKAMKEAAYVNEAAVVQSAANYWSIMASIPDIRQSITATSNTMSTLLGTYPREWEVTSDLSFALPVNVKSGIPMSYLAVRPDVRAAERGLAAAYYVTNSARAAFYPTLSISAQGGFTNLLGSMITNPGKWFIQLAGQLAAPIFSRGQNIATLEAAKARQKQAMNAFEKTVLSASADVSDALAQIANIEDKKVALDQQIDNLEKSVEYTQELLTLDQKTTYLEVLTARSSLLSAQLSSLACWHTQVASLISLYQAVGGGR
ncbi:MAG TPA: multidrug transporter [Porphyromonadaceae bacterium]|nr:multidrug transporter [Porphyromonadaceae bacterium]